MTILEKINKLTWHNLVEKIKDILRSLNEEIGSTLIIAGNNITVTGSGSLSDPYVINSTGGSSAPQGLIRFEDLAGELFTDLATATAYIQTFYAGTITNESFNNGVYLFTVPQGSDFSLLEDFCFTFSGNFIDELGLITTFGDSVFANASGNVLLGNCTFLSTPFNSFSGELYLGNCEFSSTAFYSTQPTAKITLGNILINDTSVGFGDTAQGVFKLFGNIGTTEGANYANFFATSTATIWANPNKKTSNAGGIEGDLLTAQTNGATLFFMGA